MSMQSPAPTEADERLKKDSGTPHESTAAATRAPVDAPSASTRPQTREEQQQAYLEWRKSQPSRNLTDEQRQAGAAEHVKNASKLGTLDRAKATQKTMDENREDGTDIYADETREMIHRKDQAALSQTGSTSGDRMAQGASRAGEALHTGIKENGGAFKAVDDMAGGPVLQTAEAIGLAMHAQGTISAKKDGARQETARRTKLEATQAHDEGSAALGAMRESKTAGGGYEKGRALSAFAASARTVMAHNTARRAALAAGQGTMKTMSVDHTVGEAVPIPVKDGTVIDSTLGDQARAYKDARVAELTTEKTGLNETAEKRTGGFFTKAAPEPEWQDHLAQNAEEKKSLKADNSVLEKSAQERRRYSQVSTKGYKYGLLDHEADEYHPARDAFEGANKNIAGKHEEHLKSLQSSLDELNAQGEKQKLDDRHRDGLKTVFGTDKKQSFSKKAHLTSAQEQVDKLRVEQSKNINTRIASLKTQHDSAKKSGNKVEQQRIQDQIDHHSDMLAKSRDKSGSFVSTEFLSAASQRQMHSSMNRVSKLEREKKTGLTEEQQAKQDAMRAKLDSAKANSDAGATESDLATRETHKETVEHYRFVKQHGMTPDQHDTQLENQKRILELKKEKQTGLSTEDQKKLEDIDKERTGMKGMVKNSRAFAAKHEGEKVWQGRAGGVGTDFRADRAETSDADARAATINKGAATAHRVGEVMEANLDKGREAMASGDHEHARNIAVSRAGQNIADIASSAVGGPAIGTTVKTTGQVVQAGSDIVSGLTYAGADRAKFGEHARAMTQGADGKTDQWRKVHDSVIDFHGAHDAPSEGGVKKGARQLLNMGRREFGDDIKGFASDTVKDSSLTKSIANTAASVAQPIADTVAPVAHSLVDKAAPLTDQAGAVGHSLVDQATPMVEAGAKTAHDVVNQVSDGSQSLLEHAQDSLTPAVDHIPEVGVSTGAGELVANAGEHISSQIDETGSKAHDAITQHVDELPTQAHDAITEHVDGLAGQAHEAIAKNIEGLPENLHDSVIDKAGSTAEDSVDKAFDTADAALTDKPKEPEVIGKPLEGRAAKEHPSSVTDPVSEPEQPKVPEPHPVGPKPVAGPSFLEQIRAAGEKSTNHQADKRHAPSSPVADVTKKEFNSWSQRIPRFGRNVWQRTKNFGSRMWKGIKGLFGG